MIQQYGPSRQEHPSMWKLYKGLKDLPTLKTKRNKEHEVNKDAKSAPTQEKIKGEKAAKKLRPKGSSSPKLFI